MAAPFPTVARVTRLNGRYAIVAAGTFTLTAFDWEVEIRTEFVDGTGHGDIWDVPVPLKYLWTAHVRGFFDTSSHVSYLHSAYNAQITGSPPPDITAILFSAYASNDTSVPIFTGNGFVVRTRFAAPLAMAEQELEMRGTGVPTTIP